MKDEGLIKLQVAQMEVELPSMPVSIRQTYQGKLAGSKAGLDKVKKTLVRAPLASGSLPRLTAQ